MSLAPSQARGGFDRLEQRQQHGKLFRGFHGVRQIRRHVQQVAGFEQMRFAVEAELATAGENLNQRLRRRSVLAQLLPLSKSEQHDTRHRRAQQRAADDAVGGELRFARQGKYLRGA